LIEKLKMAKLNFKLANDLKKFGAVDNNACYNCGNCTAVCPLSDENDSFPRKMVRASVLGLDDKIKSSLSPWLCYYCGECSETCPREANPGELMMTLRRWLIAKYDWTGLSHLLYTSKKALYSAFALVALAIIFIGFTKNFDITELMHWGHNFEKYAIFSVASLILVPNIFRMYWFTILKQKIKAPFSSYVKGIWDLLLHMFTQKNTLICKNYKFRWFEHFLIVIGYLTLLFTTVFLNWLGTDNIFIILLGYISAGVIFIFTFDFIMSRFNLFPYNFILKRVKKDIKVGSQEVSKFSHPTDWFFVIWLFLMALTAFLVRVFVDAGLIQSNTWLYIVHLIILAQWAVLIVPFGKWTHFLYRSFAMYFERIRKEA
jgi:ferredoxin